MELGDAVNTNFAADSTNIVTEVVENHIIRCVTLIQSVFRRWRDKKLIINSYSQFKALCKEVEHNINATFKRGFQRQYRADVSFPAVGKVEIEDTMNGMKLFARRDIFSPYTSTAKSSLLHRHEQHLQNRSLPPPPNEGNERQSKLLSSSVLEESVKLMSQQLIEPRSVLT